MKEKDGNQVDPPARFQRTDQWIPVYSWLESLDQDEVVKSKDISDWLNDNPVVKDQLCSRHSRYHLMHYIKKCHLKILKRREKKVLILVCGVSVLYFITFYLLLVNICVVPSRACSSLPKKLLSPTKKLLLWFIRVKCRNNQCPFQVWLTYSKF